MNDKNILEAKKIILEYKDSFTIDELLKYDSIISKNITKNEINIALIDLYNNGKIVKTGNQYKSRNIIPMPAYFIFR